MWWWWWWWRLAFAYWRQLTTAQTNSFVHDIILLHSSSEPNALATLLRVWRSNTLQMNRPASNSFSKSMPVERPIPCLRGERIHDQKEFVRDMRSEYLRYVSEKAFRPVLWKTKILQHVEDIFCGNISRCSLCIWAPTQTCYRRVYCINLFFQTC